MARLEPVAITGVTVRNATLHNPDYLKALGVRIGDRVLVERAGDVIPQVIRVVESRGGAEPLPPSLCPGCGGPGGGAGGGAGAGDRQSNLPRHRR